ncbi:MAG: PspA/IM30 family protein [Candidatus Dormibacteria bacterium]
MALAIASRTLLGRRLLTRVQRRLDRLFDQAENPADALDLSYRRQLEALRQVRRGVAEVVTSERRLQLQAGELRQRQERLREEARAEVIRGRDDMARLALARALETENQMRALEHHIEALSSQEQKLAMTVQRLSGRVDSFRTQRDSLKAQYAAAQASVQAGEVLTGLAQGSGDTRLMLERGEDNVRQLQARAEAIQQLVASGIGSSLGSEGDDIDAQLRPGSAGTNVETKLAQLRHDRHSSSVGPEPAASEPPPDRQRTGG